MAKTNAKFWAIRFKGDARYRITNRRHDDKSNAAIDCYGMPLSPRMVLASFSKSWRGMTFAEKTAVEKALGLPLQGEEN